MHCPNRIENTVLSGMRVEVLQQKKHIQHYKKLYAAECQTVRLLTKTNHTLKGNIMALQQEVMRLKSKLLPVQLPDKTKKRKKTGK